MSEKFKPQEASKLVEAHHIISETIVDQHGVERLIFNLDHDTKVVFRGREELPDLRPALIDRRLKPAFLGAAEPPVYCSDQVWQSYAHDLEHLMVESDQDCLVATATPLGVVDLALHLANKVSNPPPVGELMELKAKLSNQLVDHQIEELYDSIFAGCNILDEGQNRQHGLMEVALALAGQPAATEAIARKRAEQTARDERQLPETYGSSPNQPLDGATLEMLRDSHLMAVHTAPNPPDNNHRIYPTAFYTQATADCIPRISIHFSLNHPVESHFGGDFTGRRYTVVSPVADLVELNDKPDMLKDVDTYFSVEANQGLQLSDNSLLVELAPDQLKPLIIDGNRLLLREGSFDHQDIDDLRLGLEEYGVNSGYLNKWAAEAKDIYGVKAAQTDPGSSNILQENLRSLVVKAAINKLGGQVVQGGHRYVEDWSFQALVEGTAKQLGIRSNEIDHTISPEHNFEMRSCIRKQNLFQVTEVYQSSIKPATSSSLEEAKIAQAEEYWRLDSCRNAYLDLESLWQSLEGLKPVWRHIAIQADFLPYALPEKPKCDEQAMASWREHEGVPEI